MAQNLQPKEIKYLKYLKGKGFNAQDSYTRLNNVREQGLFNKTPIVSTPKKDTSFVGAMKKSALDIGNTLGEVAGNARRSLYKAGADVSKIKRGVFKNEIIGKPNETGGIEKGFIGNVLSGGIKRERAFAQKRAKQGNIGQTGIEKGFAKVGQGAGLAGGVIGEAFMSGLKTITTKEQRSLAKTAAQNIANSDIGQKTGKVIKDLGQGFNEFERQNPRTGSAIRSTTNIGLLGADVAGFGGASKIAQKVGTGIGDIPASKLIFKAEQPVGPVSDGIVQGAKIQPIGPTKPTIIDKSKQKIQNIYKGVEQRVQQGNVFVKGEVGKKQVITPIKKTSTNTLIENTKKINSLNKAFTPLQRVRKGIVVRSQENINKQWDTILNDFKNKGVNPKNMNDFRNGIIKGQKDIYKVINPALKASKTQIDLKQVIGDVYKNISPDAGVFAKTQLKQIDDMTSGLLENSRYKNMNMSKLEEVKQFINSITDWNAKGQEKVFNNFLQDFSRKIGDLQDNVLGKIEGNSGIKDLKHTYGAYSDMLGDVNKAIIKYDRKKPVGLYSGLGRLSGIGNLVKGAIKGDIAETLQGGAQIITGEVINSLNDANKIVKRAFSKDGKFNRGIVKPIIKGNKKPLALPVGKTKIAKNIILPSKKPIILKAKVNKPIISTTKSKPNKPVIATKKPVIIKKPLLLKQGTRITPQTIAKGQKIKKKIIIQNSKKGLDNTKFGNKGFINPQVIIDDIAKLPKATILQVDRIANNIVKNLGIAEQHTKVALKIVKDHIKKYGVELKNKLGDLIDKIAEKTGAKINLLGGEGALKAPVSNLERAKNMESVGHKADEIWKKTGWEKGKDGKWRFEIDDSSVDFKLNRKIGDIDNYYLDEVINHPNLFKQYPHYKDIRVEFVKGLEGKGAYNLKTKTIELNNNLTDVKALSTLMHELQHNIQQTEGFARGGNAKYIMQANKLSLLTQRGKLQKVVNDLSSSSRYKEYIYNLNKQNNEYTLLIKPIDTKISKLVRLKRSSNNKTQIEQEIIKLEKQTQKKIKEIESKYPLDDVIARRKSKYKQDIVKIEQELQNISLLGNTKAFEEYKKIAGEVEARNVQKRLGMDMEQKINTRPNLTEDIPRKLQTINR